MIATRLQSSSTSARMWLESRIVIPSPASRFTSSRMSRMPAGSSPVVGSSSSSSFGSRKQRRGDPEPLPHPVRVPADLVLRAVRELDEVEHLVDARRRSSAVEVGEQAKVAAPGEVRVEARAFDEAGDTVERTGSVGVADRARTAGRSPDVGAIRPSIMRSEVVFPAPFGPR